MTYRHIFYHTFLNMVSFECNAIYVKDVEDTSNTPKGCNAMYVEDVKDRSNTSKAVMLCMLKMGKEHTDTFLSYLS